MIVRTCPLLSARRWVQTENPQKRAISSFGGNLSDFADWNLRLWKYKELAKSCRNRGKRQYRGKRKKISRYQRVARFSSTSSTYRKMPKTRNGAGREIPVSRGRHGRTHFILAGDRIGLAGHREASPWARRRQGERVSVTGRNATPNGLETKSRPCAPSVGPQPLPPEAKNTNKNKALFFQRGRVKKREREIPVPIDTPGRTHEKPRPPIQGRGVAEGRQSMG